MPLNVVVGSNLNLSWIKCFEPSFAVSNFGATLGGDLAIPRNIYPGDATIRNYEGNTVWSALRLK